MNSIKPEPQKQSWGEWRQNHPPTGRIDIIHDKPYLLVPNICAAIFHAICDSPSETRVRKQCLAAEKALNQDVTTARNNAARAVIEQRLGPGQAVHHIPYEMNSFTRFANNLTNVHYLCANLSLVLPIHPLVTCNLQTVSQLNNPTNFAMASCSLSFHPACCEEIKLVHTLGNAMRLTLPYIKVTPFLTANFAGEGRKTFGLSFTTLPTNSNKQNTETVTNKGNASGTGSQEVSGIYPPPTLGESSQSTLSGKSGLNELNQEGSNQEAGTGFSSPVHNKENPQPKIPAVFQKQFENVPLTLLELFAPTLTVLAPPMTKVVHFRSVPNTPVIYASLGSVLIIIRLVALRCSKRNQLKKKKNSFRLIFILNQTTNFSSLALAFCSFPLASCFVDFLSSIFLLFFERIALLISTFHLEVLIKNGAGLVSSLPKITVGSVTIGPWDIVFLNLGKALLMLILFQFTLVFSGLFKTIILNALEQSLSFFIDQFCFLLNNIYLRLHSVLLYIFSIFSKKQNTANVNA